MSAARRRRQENAAARLGKADREMVLMHREIADELSRRAAERARPSVHAETETATGTIVRYEAWNLPRGHLVYEIPSRQVEAEFPTFAEARVHADQLNKWLAARPSPDHRYRMFPMPVEPTEAALVGMIDRLYEPEQQLATLSEHLQREEG